MTGAVLKRWVVCVWAVFTLGMGVFFAELWTIYRHEGMSPELLASFGLWLLVTAIGGFVAGLLWTRAKEAP